MPTIPLCVALLWLTVLLAGSADTVASNQTPPAAPPFAVLVFTKTEGFRHQSIPAGVAAIKSLGVTHNFHVDASEDASVFTDANLARYRVAIFLNTSGDILTPNQQSAFERFIRHRGGFVGIHAATDTEYEWPWYGRLVGTYFAHHPKIQPATVRVIEATHISTHHLPVAWPRTDEWYNFRHDPSPHVTVVLTVDETTYIGGCMGATHPIAWYHHYDGGRAWYTAMGHTTDSYDDPLFLNHVLGGILWTADATP